MFIERFWACKKDQIQMAKKKASPISSNWQGAQILRNEV